MTLDRHALLRALAICVVSTTLSRAAPLAPYDFTGHWTGAVTSRGQTLPASADFTSTGPRTFAGMFMLGSPPEAISCTIEGKYRRKVKLRTECSDGTKRRLTAHLNATTQTLTSAYSFVGGHGKTRQATVTLTKA